MHCLVQISVTSSSDADSCGVLCINQSKKCFSSTYFRHPFFILQISVLRTARPAMFPLSELSTKDVLTSPASLQVSVGIGKVGSLALYCSIRRCIHTIVMCCVLHVAVWQLPMLYFCCWQRMSVLKAKGWNCHAICMKVMDNAAGSEHTRSAFWIQMLRESIGWMRST